MTTARTLLPESQMGPAERLLDVVLGSSAHLWHNRPGIDRDGTWVPAKGQTKNVRGKRVQPGLFVPAAVALYQRLLEIHKLNADLMAHLASYALVETDWRDLKVAGAKPARGACALVAQQVEQENLRLRDSGVIAFSRRQSCRVHARHFQSRRWVQPSACSMSCSTGRLTSGTTVRV